MSRAGTVVCLHGFLGRAQDWSSVTALWPWQLRCPNWFEPGPQLPATLPLLANALNRAAERWPAPRILLGYSLGGRVALHAAFAEPLLWTGVVAVSAHLGLPDPQARAERQRSDEAWAKRFEIDDWPSLVHDWDRQAVFAGRDSPFVRRAADFSRAHLAHALRAYSLGAQLPLQLGSLAVPLLWVSGRDDAKQTALSSELAQLPRLRHVRIPHAAHRVPWEAPSLFNAAIQPFISQLTETRIYV